MSSLYSTIGWRASAISSSRIFALRCRMHNGFGECTIVVPLVAAMAGREGRQICSEGGEHNGEIARISLRCEASCKQHGLTHVDQMQEEGALDITHI